MSRTLHVQLPFTPRRHQREAHEGRKRFSVLVWHRRAGKTVFAVVELVLAALMCKREAGRFAYVAPFLKQAKAVAWEYLARYARVIPGCTVNESELSVLLPNGASVRLYGADHPDSLRGIYLDGVVLDEVADMRPQVWGEVIRPALADRQGWALFIGTPKGVNLFSELYYRALKDPEWFADMRRASDTDAIPEEELERARREMSAPQYAQEFDCDFAAAVENTLIPLAAVLAAQTKTLGEAEYTYAAKVLGVDVARYGDDKTVIMPRQGLVTFKPRWLSGFDTMEVASQVAHSIDKWKPDATFVDVGGVGGGVVDRLKQLGFYVIPVDFASRPVDPSFANKRAEMWWGIADWVKVGGCLPDIQDLTRDLTAITYNYANARGKRELESKDDMRARGLPSPDFGDALACTFFQPIAPPPPESRLPGYRGNQVTHEFNPYAERAA